MRRSNVSHAHLGRQTIALVTLLALGAAILPVTSAAAAGPRAPAGVAALPEASEVPVGLRVAGLDRPTDLEDVAAPAFSWQHASLPQQSAYQIVVSTTSGGEADLWDSGKVVSADQRDTTYGGDPLAASQRYYWTVRVWDGADRATGWAEESWFGTSPGPTWQGATPVWAPSSTTGWNDYTYSAQVTITAVAVGLRFRVNGTNSYMWQFRGSDNRLVPHKQTNGAYATLGSAVNLPAGTLTVGSQATISIQVAGSTITTRVNGVQIDQRSDATYANGVVGVRTGNAESALLDDITVVSATGATLLSDDLSGSNPFTCGTVQDGALSLPPGSNCGLTGYGNDWAMLRKDVQVADKEIAWATLFATGTEWKASRQYTFKASIDGTFVGLGPTAPIGTETRFDGFDVTSLLTRGETSTVSLIANSSSPNARVLAQLQIQYADGSRQVVGTGADWQALAAGVVYPSPGSYGTSYFAAPRENLDARRFPVGFDRPGFDAAGWTAAQERPAIGGLRAAPMAKVEQQLRAPAKVTDLPDGSQVVDFGRTWLGGIAWDLASGSAGTQVQVRFGQVLNADGSVRHQSAATNTYLDTLTLRDGAQHLETWGLRTFRYVQVVDSPEPVTPSSLKAVALVYPFDEQASTLASSNANLDQVYALSKNTIEATNLNFYTDSWERERSNHEADAYLQLMSSLYLMDDLSLGRYSMDYFKTNRTWPTEWPAYVVMAVHDAWRHSGDTAQVADYYDNLKAKLPSKWLESSTGLVRKTTGVNCSSATDCDMVDWPTVERDGYVFAQYNTVINAITYRTLVDMGEMAAALGKDAEAASYAEQAAALRAAINAKLYDPATGSYDDGADASGALTGHASVHASAFALAFGVPADDQRAKVASYVASRGMACSVYCAAFLIQGQYAGGDGQTALDLMTAESTRSWMNMIRAGAGATMEAWDISLRSNTTYSHPWAASPAFNIPSGVFGIRPLTAGYETLAIRPQPGDLEWGAITTPTVRGRVGAAFARGEDGTTVVASVPGNTRASVAVPTTATAPARLFVDGAPRTVTPEDGRFELPLGAGCHVLSPTAEVADLERLTAVCAVAPTLARSLTASMSADGGRGWYGAGAALRLTPAGEDAGDAVVEYRIGAGAWTTYTSAVVLAEGSYDVDWRLRDGAEVVAEDTVPVRVDTRQPALTTVVAGRSVTLVATDPGGATASGVETIEYRVDAGAWTAYASPLVLDGGAHVVAARATDRAGNLSAVEQVSLEAVASVVPATPAVPTAPVAITGPQVSGPARYGASLTATAGGWDVAVATSLQWMRDGAPIAGATGASYRIGAGDVGARLAVRVAATAPGRPAGTALSAPTAPIAKGVSRTAVKISPRPARQGGRIRVVVTVTGAGASATGQVRVKVAGKTVTKSLTAGRLRLRVRAGGRGVKSVKVRYLGNGALAGSTGSRRYRVREGRADGTHDTSDVAGAAPRRMSTRWRLSAPGGGSAPS